MKNTGILAIGQIGSKVFTFLLLPLYTSRLTPDDYGGIDVIQTITSLSLYFVTLQLECALFRYLVDTRESKEESARYITSAVQTIFISNIFSTILFSLISLFIHLDYLILLILGIWSQSFFFAFSNVARGFGKNKDYSIASFIVTITSLIINLLFILVFNLGGKSILYALVISNMAGAIYLFIVEKLWVYLRRSYFSNEILKEMLAYSLPLIPNAISWWVANASDRLLILAYIGTVGNGIYAAANKIPTIYTTLFSVFNLAWAESVSLSMKDNDRDMYIKTTYDSSIKFFSVINLGIICSMSLFFEFLIGEEYRESYFHIYILLIAIFFNSLCSLLGGILTGYKETKIIGLSTVIGGITNLIINFVLIKQIGLYAASISTLVSYIAIWLVRLKRVNKHVILKTNRRFLIQLGFAIIVVSAAYYIRITWVTIVTMIALCVWGAIMNKRMIIGLKNSLLRSRTTI